jgi:hypothetical protein
MGVISMASDLEKLRELVAQVNDDAKKATIAMRPIVQEAREAIVEFGRVASEAWRSAFYRSGK